MRVVLLVGLSLVVCSLFAQKEVKVATYEELIEAIDNPDIRSIKITEKWLFISETPQGDEGLASSLIIEERKNLKIEGIKGGTHLITRSEDAVTLALISVNNVRFKRLVIGHAPERGKSCMAGVVEIQNSVDVEFEDCTLFGCGTYGIYAMNSDGLLMRDCEIRSCTEGIVFLVNCAKATFESCLFTDHSYSFYAFSFAQSTAVLFNKCELNLTRGDYDQEATLFSLSESQTAPVVFKACEIAANSAYYWKEDPSNSLEFKNCDLKHNFYQMQSRASK